MASAKFYIGDVFDVLATLEPGSVDLVMTCKHGHELTEQNRNAQGRCRECQNVANRRYRERDADRTREQAKRYHEAYRAKPATHEHELERGRLRRADPEYREYNRAYSVGYRSMLRRQALDAYGHKCACCGSERARHLAIDHIEGGGNKHREELGGGGLVMFRWLRDNDYPEGFQTLCHNCNFEKHAYGECGCSA